MSAPDLTDRLVSTGARLVRARVARVDESAGVLVSLGPNSGAALACDVLRIGGPVPRFSAGDEVLVALMPDGSVPGVILGVIQPGAQSGTDSAAPTVSADPPAGGEASIEAAPRVIEGRTVRIEADEELTLQCGAASITIVRDGRVIIRGEHVLTRARGTNRIKGGSVAIN